MDMIDLNGDWQVREGENAQKMPARVPGDIHLDLMAADQIPDPFYRDNEEKLMWIGERDWVYSRSFNVDAEHLQRERVVLQCEGLDTLAEVSINGHHVGSADNMFRTWEWDVKDYLEKGENTIEVWFKSVFPEIERLQAERYYLTGGGPVRHEGGCQVRKEPCNFGWDWGPRCVTCGIWRPIRLVALDHARLSDVQLHQEHEENEVELTIEVAAENIKSNDLQAEVSVSQEGEFVACETLNLKQGSGTGQVTIEDPKLWWPNGMGAQNLYEVEVVLLSADGTQLDSTRKRIGIRTLRLVQQPDAWGQSFHFEVNGIPFFAKGGNWIPTDVFQPRVTEEVYRRRLQSCADSNMNMIRVWGGGIYEEDIFYDICDELGLCVWQDFMFACAAYPAARPSFMENVRAEVTQNLKRLRHHPCIALYCGNNELEQCGFVTDDPAKEGAMTWAEYKSLFDELLPGLVREYDPKRPYIPSSEYSPAGDRKHSAADWCGDVHLWQVWHGYKPFEWYRTSFHRFCSEYGFQSFPEPKTCRSFTNEDDRNLNSSIMNKHQRCYNGNPKIVHYMLDWYRLPSGFENSVWLSQIQQGLAIKYAVEHWRRNKPRCMGSLYWQINDCWPVASWASIDSFGRAKALQYMARHFYAPLLLSGLENPDEGTVELHVSSDCLEEKQCQIQWTVTDAQGNELRQGTVPVVAKENANTHAETLNIADLIAEYTRQDILVWVDLYSENVCVSSNTVTFERPRNFALPDPGIHPEITDNGDGSYEVTLHVDKPALWAWLELQNLDAHYSDNFVCLRPGQPYNIHVVPEESISKAALEEQLIVRSIYDTY